MSEIEYGPRGEYPQPGTPVAPESGYEGLRIDDGDGGAAGLRDGADLCVPVEIETRWLNGFWWSKWTPGPPVWARGSSAAKADAELARLVSCEPLAKPGDTDLALSATVDGAGYAAFGVVGLWPLVVATGETERDAVELLVAHVPIPQPTEVAGEEPPPALEDEPLPPV